MSREGTDIPEVVLLLCLLRLILHCVFSFCCCSLMPSLPLFFLFSSAFSLSFFFYHLLVLVDFLCVFPFSSPHIFLSFSCSLFPSSSSSACYSRFFSSCCSPPGCPCSCKGGGAESFVQSHTKQSARVNQQTCGN